MKLEFSLGDIESTTIHMAWILLDKYEFEQFEYEVIGLQMQLNVEGSGDATMEGHVEDIVTKKEEYVKKKWDRVSILKSKGTPNNKTKIDTLELGDLEGEEEVPIKLRDYKVGALITIHGEIKDIFIKSTRKQGMQ